MTRLFEMTTLIAIRIDDNEVVGSRIINLFKLNSKILFKSR